MNPIESFQRDPLAFTLYLVGLVIAFSLHELGHAWAAVSQGDPTPRDEGRLTLNPLKHIDPLGMILLIFVGFGWARPVVTRPGLYKNGVWSELLVSSAGILANLGLFLVAGLALRFMGIHWADGLTRGEITTGPAWLQNALARFASLNVTLIVFNALPIPPLDGSHILSALIPGELGRSLRFYANRSSYLLLLALVLFRGPISEAIGAAQDFAFSVLPGR